MQTILVAKHFLTPLDLYEVPHFLTFILHVGGVISLLCWITWSPQDSARPWRGCSTVEGKAWSTFSFNKAKRKCCFSKWIPTKHETKNDWKSHTQGTWNFECLSNPVTLPRLVQNLVKTHFRQFLNFWKSFFDINKALLSRFFGLDLTNIPQKLTNDCKELANIQLCVNSYGFADEFSFNRKYALQFNRSYQTFCQALIWVLRLQRLYRCPISLRSYFLAIVATLPYLRLSGLLNCVMMSPGINNCLTSLFFSKLFLQ